MFQFRALRYPFLAMLIFLLLTGSMVFAADQPEISQRLTAAMAKDDFAWRNSDGTLTIWVFFRDKGLQGTALEEALLKAEKQLDERTAWRRAKVKNLHERLVDAGDLPVNPQYLNLVKATGATLRRESRWLNAASFTVTHEQVEELSALAFIRKMDLVARFQRRPIPVTAPLESNPANDLEKASNWTIDYGANLASMEQVGVPAVHEMGFNGQGVIIGMLDSGFHPTHEALAGIPVLATYDFVNDDENVDNEEGDPSTAKDHGTMTMSTAVGNMPGELVAPAFGASVVLAKTEDVAEEVPIEEDQWVAGLEWVETFGVDIVSSSLGYLDWYEFSDMDGNTAVTTIAADLAAGRGIVVVNSAGNERGSSWNHIIAPADGDSVITVGAVTSSGDLSSFSSPGPSYDGRIKPDVAALGTNNTVANPNDDYAYRTASGTSFSCPLTSGVAALVLSRAPNLTPMQVREALRETASMADAPNNDFGWGIINAYEAVHYFGPTLVHTPLSDTEETGAPYTVEVVITARTGLISSTLNYRLDGASWQQATLVATGEADTYAADIPGQAAGVIVDYYLSATSENDILVSLPSYAPEDFYTFRVGVDVTAPVLSHTALPDQALVIWPPTILCTATDNLGIDRVELEFQHNGGPVMGPYLLNADGDDQFSILFPLTSAEVQYGDAISYTITAFDAAGTPNSAANGPNPFTVIETLGVILVLEDGGSGKADSKFGADKQRIHYIAEGKSSAPTIAGWLAAAGYVAHVMPAADAVLADFQPYQAVVLSAGNSTTPVATEGLRLALQSWANSGGKILIEGGEIGYDALANPGYPDFAAQVLHATDWTSDSSNGLQVVSGQENHPLLNSPHTISATVDITYGSYGDEDAMSPALDAEIIMETGAYAGKSGILVYDDNHAPQSAQVVYFAFNIEAMDTVVGVHLILNSISYLLAIEGAPTSSLSGTITLAGESDHSGILVSAGGGTSTLTAGDGSWLLQDLYEGLYDLSVTKELWGDMVIHVDVAAGEHLGDLDLTMFPVVYSDYAVSPGLTIPDNSPAGILSPIVVPEGEAGIISGVTVDVDISHTWIGDLTVKLISPDFQEIILHNRSGSSSDDIQGNWPETLVVEGPGNLSDFIGMSNAGTWYLFVADSTSPDEGILNSWGLHFLIPGVVSSVGDNTLPKVTRLNPNVPNPFNPMTRISFDLARGGAVQLGIYDLRGMMVRRLVSENLEAGSHTMQWDGLDDGGRSVGSGVYLYRLESPDGVRERKMVLVR